MSQDLGIRPERLLPAERLDALARPQHLAVVQIAGRDSVAAAVLGVRERGYRMLLPTLAYAGTETGDAGAPLRAVEALRGRIAAEAEVLPPVTLGEHRLWSAMNARFASEIQRRFGVCSPCMACHTYLHLVRVPLAWRLGRVPVVSGERDTHGGRIKLSQTAAAIDVATEILAHAGIELVEPVRAIADGGEIASIVGDAWDDRAPQLGCVLSGNYVSADGMVRYDEAGYGRYLAEFLRPAGFAVIDAWRSLGWDEPRGAEEPSSAEEPDYEGIVREVLTA